MHFPAAHVAGGGGGGGHLIRVQLCCVGNDFHVSPLAPCMMGTSDAAACTSSTTAF